MSSNQVTLQAMERIGSVWEKAGKKRIYFNDLPRYYGLKVEFYNTGNVAHATLDGEHISNSTARGHLAHLQLGKVYYDCKSGTFESQGLPTGYFPVILPRIAEEIARIAAEIDGGEKPPLPTATVELTLDEIVVLYRALDYLESSLTFPNDHTPVVIKRLDEKLKAAELIVTAVQGEGDDTH